MYKMTKPLAGYGVCIGEHMHFIIHIYRIQDNGANTALIPYLYHTGTALIPKNNL